MKKSGRNNRIQLVSVWAFVFLAITSCGKDAENIPATRPPNSLTEPSPYGTFRSTGCFLNKLATQGMGHNVYSRATIEFRENGTGTTSFELSDVADCSNIVQAGQADFAYEEKRFVATAAGPALVVQVDQQNDPSDPSDILRYYLVAVVEQRGYTIDIDFTDGQSGPYLTDPTPSDLSDYALDPRSRGTLFERQ